MTTTSVSDIKKLRDKTGAGMMAAKSALEEANGDLDKAIAILRLKDIATARGKADRTTANGLIEAYVHSGKIGVLVELMCETDFVARTDDFKELIHGIAMQVAATNPAYLSPEDVPADVIHKDQNLYRTQAKTEGKKTDFVDKIVEGKLAKFYSEVCLIKQPFIKDPNVTIEDLIKEKIAKLGENITLTRYVRMELGQ